MEKKGEMNKQISNSIFWVLILLSFNWEKQLLFLAILAHYFQTKAQFM